MALDLRNIDPQNIDWEALETEVGQEIVREIRNLSSDNPQVRESTLDSLFDSIYHQGMISNLTPIVAPFWVHRLQHERNLELLSRILYGLAALAETSSQSDPRATYEFLDQQYPLDEQLTWKIKSHSYYFISKAVYKGVNLYLDFLEHDSSEVRMAAICVLAANKFIAAEFVSKFYERVRQEPEPLIRATVLLLLAIFDKVTPLETAFVEEIFDSDEPEIVKLAAAIALAYVAGENPSHEVLEKLIQLGNRPNLLLELGEYYDRYCGDFHGLFACFFDRLGDRALAKMLPVLTHQWGFADNYYYFNLLFEIVIFPKLSLETGMTIEDLTQNQQWFLQAIAHEDGLWSPESEYHTGQVGYFLGEIGMKKQPTRDKLIRFLGGEVLQCNRYRS